MNFISKSRLRKKEIIDSGISGKYQPRTQRIINPDGSFNVRKRGLGYWESFNFYHWLIYLSLFKFIVLVLVYFIIINLIFAGLYTLAGTEHLAIPDAYPWHLKFLEAFFFSAQTLTTVGYGKINPHGVLVNFIASFEAFLGLLMFALATGLVYGRFAKPKTNIIRSKNALISPYKDIRAVMFRIVNGYFTNMIDPEITFMLSRLETDDGSEIRKFYTLDLEYSKINFFASVWTVVHPIDENSPLYGITAEDLHKSEAELLVLFKGYDNTFGQIVNSRFSYRHTDVVWGAKFHNALEIDEEGKSVVAIDKISSFDKVEL